LFKIIKSDFSINKMKKTEADMAQYSGKKWKKSELMSYIGDTQQAAGARPFIYSDGKAQGVSGISVRTGSGFEFTVLPGRGMDIPEVLYKGKMINFLTGTGITAPGYYEEPGMGWLRGFFGGLLTTCGITNSGAPTVDQGTPYGIHGRVSNAGAEDVCLEQKWVGDEFIISIKGKIREASAMGENMSLTRTFETKLGSKSFRMVDVIENHGFEPQPLLMLYHFNFGYPLLSPNAKVVGPVLKTEPRDEQAAKDNGAAEYNIFPEPQPGYLEKVFFHTLGADSDGRTFISLLNKDTGDGNPLGMILRFNKKEVPVFTQWKMPQKGFYVMGLEPGTGVPLGRGVLREMNLLPYLEGQKQQTITIDFEVLDSLGEFDAVEKEAEKLKR
jgi:hypothetical protein